MPPFWISLEIRMMEVVMTTGAIRCAKLQSNHCHQQQQHHSFNGHFKDRPCRPVPEFFRTETNEKKRSEETQTLHAGCGKAEPKMFAPPQTLFLRAWDERFFMLKEIISGRFPLSMTFQIGSTTALTVSALDKAVVLPIYTNGTWPLWIGANVATYRR